MFKRRLAALGCSLALVHCSQNDVVTLTGDGGISTSPPEPAPDPVPPAPMPTVEDAIQQVFEHPTMERLDQLEAEHQTTEEEAFVMILYWAGLAEAEETGVYPDGFERVAAALDQSIAEWPSLSPPIGALEQAISFDSQGRPEGECNAQCSAELANDLTVCASRTLSLYLPQLPPSEHQRTLSTLWRKVSTGLQEGKAFDLIEKDVRETTVLQEAADSVSLLVTLIAGAEFARLDGMRRPPAALAGLSGLASRFGILATVLGAGDCGRGLQARFNDAKRCLEWKASFCLSSPACQPLGVWSLDCYLNGPCPYEAAWSPAIIRVHQSDLVAEGGVFYGQRVVSVQDGSARGSQLRFPYASYVQDTCQVFWHGYDYGCGDGVDVPYRFGDEGYDFCIEGQCPARCDLVHLSGNPDAPLDEVAPLPEAEP